MRVKYDGIIVAVILFFCRMVKIFFRISEKVCIFAPDFERKS